MENLFDQSGGHSRKAPLADRMRPRDLSAFEEQDDILGPGKPLRRAIENDSLGSVILHGPPGTGKTTLARIIAGMTRSHFETINAVMAGVADIRRVVQEARERRSLYSEGTILFIDEIHRFNKAQQDALLPFVEDGTIILIGATTENPYFEVNSALLSRSRVFALQPLTGGEITQLLKNALSDPERGLGMYRVQVEEKALEHLVKTARGDARSALNALELAVLTTSPDPQGIRQITLSVAEESIQKPAVLYDKQGDQHYDVISAFIKSMRGSDPDAALHWLARMLYAGEDPRFIARRLIIHASEDVGLADPQALQVAVAAAQALEYAGMPEARIPLAQAVIYIATAPKSNAVICAIDQALEDIEKRDVGRVPIHLRDASYRGASQLGHGKGYLYPHDYPGNYVEQQYLPDPLLGTRYYNPTANGNEAKVRERLRRGGK